MKMTGGFRAWHRNWGSTSAFCTRRITGSCRRNSLVSRFVYSGGIRLPHYHGAEKWDEGSGNIVISGRPGVGKSTLAFQFAAACAAWPNDGIAVYFSLDVEEKQLVKSMRDSDSDLCINFLCDYSMMESSALSPYDVGTDEELEDMFRKALYKKSGKGIPQIILPKLSPRGISPVAGAETDSIFLKRISELQKLLRAISAYNAGSAARGRRTGGRL